MINFRALFIAFIFFISVLTSCKTSYNVVKVDSGNITSAKNGFYYTLPKTYFKINITLNAQENIKGPYSEFAKQYFGLTNVISQNSISWQIKDVSIESVAEPDTSSVFFVEINNSPLNVTFNESGMLKDVNCSKSDISNVNYEQKAIVENNNIQDFPVLFKKFADLNLYEKVDTFYKKIKVDTTFIIEKTYKTSLVEKTTELKVKEVAEYISKLKEAKFNVISGEIDASDKKNLEFMYNEIQNQEEQYLKLFTGISFNKQITYSFNFYPQKDTNFTVIQAELAKFSIVHGFVSIDDTDVANEPIILRVSNNNSVPKIINYQKRKKMILKEKKGFYYCLPALAIIDVLKNEKVIYTTTKEIPQLGTVLYLPVKNLSLIFDENTGNIKKLKIND